MSRIRRTAATVLGVVLVVLGAAVGLGLLDGMDRAVNAALSPRHASDWYVEVQQLADALTTVMNPRLVVPVTLAAGLVLHRRGNRAALRTVLPPVLAMAGSVIALKVALRRAGPPGSPPVDLLGWWPSGHTATSLVCLGALAALSGRRWPRWATGIVTTALAGSMLVIRAHWLSDLAGAAVLGALILVVLLPSTDREPAGQPAGLAGPLERHTRT